MARGQKRKNNGRFFAKKKFREVSEEETKHVAILLGLALAALLLSPLTRCVLHREGEPSCCLSPSRHVSETWLRRAGLDPNNWNNCLGMPLGESCYSSFMSPAGKRIKIPGFFSPLFFFLFFSKQDPKEILFSPDNALSEKTKKCQGIQSKSLSNPFC